MKDKSKIPNARWMAVADGEGGGRACDLALRIARWFSARGMHALLVDFAMREGAPGNSSRGGAGMRSAGDVAPLVGNLDDDALRGYLSSGGEALGRIAAGGDSLDEAVVDRLSRAYAILLIAAGSPPNLGTANGFSNLPVLVFVDVARNGGVSSAGKLIDLLLEEKRPVRPLGFVIPESDRLLAAKLSRRWHLPSWGSADEADHLAQRVLDNAVPVFLSKFKEGAAEDGVRDEVRAGRELEAARKVLKEIRSQPEFRDIRVSWSDVDASGRLRRRVGAAAKRLVESHGADPIDAGKIVEMVVDDAMGCGPLEPLLADPSITELMVNGPHEVYVERGGAIDRTHVKFADASHLLTVIERMVSQVNRRIDESSPMVDARMPDGSRINAIIPPLAVDGPSLTVRRFAERPGSIEDLIKNGMLTREAATFLTDCVRERVTVVVSGGTGAGKTTLLGVLASAIGGRERVITIEDSAELCLSARHVVRLEARPPNIEGAGEITIRDLVRNALRMRPDRIIVGECRGPEALDMLQAMNTGHEGSLTTVHANSPRDAISRLETMVMMSNADLPLVAIREQIVRSIDLIVQVERGADGVRRVVEISEITGMEGPTACMQTLAVISPEARRLKPTGFLPRFAERLKAKDVCIPLLKDSE